MGGLVAYHRSLNLKQLQVMFHNKRTEKIIHFEPTHILTDKLECVCILYAQYLVDRYVML